MYDYTVPQEFNQGDRIGNFTMPQLAIVGCSVLIFMLMMASGVHIILMLILLIPQATLTLFLMYKKYYDIPVYEFALIYLVYKATPKLLIYRKENVRDEYIEEEMLFFEED